MYSGAASRTGFFTFSPSAHRYSYCAIPARSEFWWHSHLFSMPLPDKHGATGTPRVRHAVLALHRGCVHGICAR